MIAWLASRRDRRQRIRRAALQAWARAEAQRTRASRFEHGCIPTAYGMDFAPVASEDMMRDFTGEKAPADYDG